MKSFLSRADVWALIVKSGHVLASSFQAATLGIKDFEVPHSWNIAIALFQAGLTIVSFWTEDKNKNNKIDILEDPTSITIEHPPTGN